MGVRITENLKIQGIIFRSVRKNYGGYANVIAENLKNRRITSNAVRYDTSYIRIVHFVMSQKTDIMTSPELIPHLHHQTYNSDDYDRTRVSVATNGIGQERNVVNRQTEPVRLSFV